jgi:type I restriction enzyme R subunit
MNPKIIESTVEEATLEYLAELGYSTAFAPEISPGGLSPERESHGDVILADRLRTALYRLNPNIPREAVEEAFLKVARLSSASLYDTNHNFHYWLVNGVPVEYFREDRTICGDQVKLFDFDNPENNDFLAVNQFTVIEAGRNRRADVVIFVNGLPLAVIELKNPGDENATTHGAFNQLQTYKQDIPSLFHYNELLVVSDGVQARAGTLTSNWERFMPWRTIDGKAIAKPGSLELGVLLKGMLEPSRFLDLIRYFTVFNVNKKEVIKKLAGYHQYHAVNKAVDCTLKATSPKGDKRVGVVWHTQGSGKSLSMVFYSGKVIQQPAMENPTLVLLTDRNDLDDQLFGEFSASHELLRQEPSQAGDRDHLREILKRASGGVIFTTIQKFLPEIKGDQYPLISDRRNIVVIADEAHRSQYDFIDGFARHMRDALPNASFIGFTGTPIEKDDKSTRRVFGDYIDVYDIQRAVEDKVTVRIFYEARLAKLDLKASEKPKLDAEFEEVTELEESGTRSKLKSKWTRLEALVGSDKRIDLVAEDLVKHFEERQNVMDGKGLIVCMSRRICVKLYEAIIKLRPQWHNPDDTKGFLKVVMTGSASDPLNFQPHIRQNKKDREKIADRFKNPDDPLKLVIVRDMWLTGFDVPCLHTMYLDKPMRGHGLMQAIARVNRVFKDKPGGLVVDYLGLADELKKALLAYSESDRHEVGIDQEEAVEVLMMKYEIIKAMFHKFDYSPYFTEKGTKRLETIPSAMEHILSLEDGKKRFMQAVVELSQAFALAVPNELALAIRDEVGFFQTLRASFVKSTPVDGTKTVEELDAAIRQIISQAVSSGGVVDIFKTAGLEKPDISILSDEFLDEMRGYPHKNLAVEALAKLLKDQIKARFKTNVVKERSFSDMLEQSLKRYQNRAIEAAQVIEELIALAKELKEAEKRGEELGLTDDEVALYDALAQNDSAKQVLGDEILRKMSQILVERLKADTTVDWAVRDAIRAKLRLMVKKILKQYGYPPDLQDSATQLVLEQAEKLSELWVAV